MNRLVVVLIIALLAALTSVGPASAADTPSFPTGAVSGAAGVAAAGGGLPVAPRLITEFGASGAGPGLLIHPYGVALDGSGDVFATDVATSTVDEYNSSALFVRSFGGAGSGAGKLNDPRGITVAPSGDVVVADSGNDRVEVFDGVGTFVRSFGVFGGGKGQLQTPVGVTTDTTGNVYVADSGNGRIEEFSAVGVFVRTYGFSGAGSNGALLNPEGVAVDGTGNVFATDTGGQRVEVFSPPGAYMSQWGIPGAGVGHFMSPSGIALDGNGNVFVTETGVMTNRVQQFDTTGTPLNMWGSAGGGSFEFARPTSIVVTGSGAVFVADEFNGRVQQFALQARPPLPPPVPLRSFPLGSPFVNRTATVDPSGNTFEFTNADNLNVATCALTKYSPTGQQLWQQATVGRGQGQFCGNNLQGSADGISRSLATDRNGDVYVKESGLQRIQVFGSTGTFLRSWQSPHFLDNTSQTNFWDGPMTIDTNDHLWVYDAQFNEMQESTLTGTPLTSWAVPGTVLSDNTPALAFDPVLGHLVLAVNDTLLTLTTAGAAVTAPRGLPNAPFGSTVSITGIAADAAGHIVVAANFFSTILNTALPSRLDVLDGAGNLLTAVNPVLGVADTDDTSVDSAGKLYVLADKFGTPQIQIFGPIVPAALPPPLFVQGFGVIATDGGFQAPQALSTAANGDVYVSTVGTFSPHSRVYRFNADGVLQNVFGGDCALTNSGLCPPPALGLFTSYSGAYQTADDGNGTVYVTDHWNSRIEEFSPGGTYLGQFPTGPDPLALGIDGTGNLDAILVDLDPSHSFGQRQIEQYTPAGAVVRRWGPSLATVQSVQPNMNWLAIDPQGNIVALIHENNEGQPVVGSVQRFSPAGVLLETWPLADPAEAIAVDRHGNVYTYSAEAHTIDVSDPHGRPLGSWANPHFVVPTVNTVGLAVGPNGRVYVTDPVDETILMYDTPVFVQQLQAVGASAVRAVVSSALTVSALDAQNVPVPSYHGTVHFTSTDPFAELPADYPFTAADSGTHSFPVSFHSSGPQTVTATDTADTALLGVWSTVVITGPPGTGVQVPPGGSVSTSAPGAVPNPLIVQVQTPQGGTVDVDTSAGTNGLPVGYSALGFGAIIVAPPGTVASPLQLSFQIPVTAIPSGTPASAVTVFRNGSPIADCLTTPSSTATPDPCVATRTIVGTVLTLVVLTTHASTWGFGVPDGSALVPASTLDHFPRTVGTNNFGDPERFWIDGPQVIHSYRTNGTWSTPSPLGGPPGGIRSTEVGNELNFLNNAELYVVANDGQVWHDYATPGQGSGWSGWYPMGKPAGPNPISGQVVVGRNYLNNQELYVLAGGQVYHSFATPGQGSGWSGWDPLGAPAPGITGDVHVSRNYLNNQELYATAPDGQVYHKFSTPGQGSGWSNWDSLGSPASAAGDVAVWRNWQNNQEMFRIAANTIWHDYATPGLGTGWSGWNTFTTPPGVILNGWIGLDAAAPAGNLTIWVRDVTGHYWSASLGTDNNWSAWTPTTPSP